MVVMCRTSGLPGNPVSAMVAFEQFGRPAIRVMLGKAPLQKPTINATLDDPVYNHDGRRVYARVDVYKDDDGRYRARSTGNQSSGALHSMAIARGFAICPDDVASVPAGSEIAVEILEWPDERSIERQDRGLSMSRSLQPTDSRRIFV